MEKLQLELELLKWNMGDFMDMVAQKLAGEDIDEEQFAKSWKLMAARIGWVYGE